ncbi:MAG: HAD-IIIA family hydrolase [Gammaproteobacteria bacterium]|nr:HAD-IIIA family hydrolase [Gammaproteobacteria bacterium]
MQGNWDPPYLPEAAIIAKAARIRLALFDVDGVMTDGKLHFSDAGEELKVFNVYDGHGIVLLTGAGIATGVITARQSTAVEQRTRELGINHVLSGCRDKLPAFQELIRKLEVPAEACAYVGDDLVDLPVMRRCGLSITVRNANHVVKRAADWTTPSTGGNGAVREVCELILCAQQKFDACVGAYLR